MLFGPIEHKTNIRFKKKDDFEKFIYAKDLDYDSEDIIFTGLLYIKHTSIP